MLDLYLCAIWVVEPSGRVLPACVAMTSSPLTPERALALITRNQGAIVFLDTQIPDDDERQIDVMFPLEQPNIVTHPNQSQHITEQIILMLDLGHYAHYRAWQRYMQAKLLLKEISPNALTAPCLYFTR
jgi:hypothetical protein